MLAVSFCGSAVARGKPAWRPTAILSAATLVLIAVASVGSANASAAECSNLPPSTLRVYATAHDTVEAAPADAATLDALASQVHIVERMREPHPLLVIIPRVTSQFSVEDRTIETMPGTYCAAPVSVELRLGITDYVGYIAREAYADPCIRQKLLEHARRHLAVDNAGVSELIRETKDPFAGQLARLKEIPARRSEDAAQSFRSAVAALVLGVGEKFARERASSHGSIDSSAEITKLRNSCRGAMSRLEAEILSHGRQTQAKPIPAAS